jgi:hypothetical protein
MGGSNNQRTAANAALSVITARLLKGFAKPEMLVFVNEDERKLNQPGEESTEYIY